MKIYSYSLFFLFQIVFSAQAKNTKDEIVVQKSVSLEWMQKNSHKYGMMSSEIKNCLKYKLFNPNNSGSRLIHLKPIASVGKVDWNKLQKLETELLIYELLNKFYRLFPDQMKIDNNIQLDQDMDYEYYANQLEYGNSILQCSDISKLSKKWINTFLGSRFQCDLITIPYPEHSLNILKYEEKGNLFLVLIDFQNGFAYPYDAKNKTFIRLRDLRKKHIENKDGFLFLSNKSLNQKRIFMNEILPKNFLFPNNHDYFLCSDRSKFKLMLEAKSFHHLLWFDKKYISNLKFRNVMMEYMFNWIYFKR
jgi:hypothetical protein